jgi:competence protein ComEA
MDASSTTSAPAPPRPSRAWSAQVSLGVFLAVTLGLLALRGYGTGLVARPSAAAPPALTDLNAAGRAELEQVPGVGPSLAREIADDRQRRGAFRSVEELRRVKGVGPATLDKLRGFFRAEAPADAPAEPLVLERKPTPPPVPAPYPRPGGAAKKLQPGDPPVNVNAAPVDELMRLPGVGPVTAQAIVAARAEKPFRSVADLDRVRGIGPKTLDKLRPFVVTE